MGALPVLCASGMEHSLILSFRCFWGLGTLRYFGALVLIVGDLRAFVLVDASRTMMLLGFRCLWGLVLMDFQF
jgi:hypothetical protein